MFLTVSSYHLTHALQMESTFYSCLNFKEFLAQSRPELQSLSDCNGARTHNYSACEQTLNHLAKLAKWLSCVASTYLHGAFDCMFLSCHVGVSEWIHCSIIWPVWLNGWVFLYELSGCGFESRCSDLNFMLLLVSFSFKFTITIWISAA